MPSAIARERAARRELRDAVDALRELEVDAGLRRPTPRRWWVLASAVMVVTVVGAVLAVTAWISSRDGYTDADFEQAAAERVAVLIAPDHRDPSRARTILAGATGAFYDEFGQAADAYSTFVEANGAVTESSVDGTGISGRSGDEATVLVAATVTFADRLDDDDITNPGSATGLRRFRLRVLVTPDDGTLKLGAVQYLP